MQARRTWGHCLPQAINVVLGMEVVKIRDDIYNKLIDVARSRSLISYDDLNIELGLGLNFSEKPSDRDLIGRWLGEISKHEVKAGRHMLSAVVGHKEGGRVVDPGKGFYGCARALGIHTGGDDLVFWAMEVKWLHEYWSSH
jgi:hypothetical protein